MNPLRRSRFRTALAALSALLLWPLHSAAQLSEHDPSLLAKLRDGRFAEISMKPQGRLDLAAVVQALGDSACRFQLESKTPFDTLLQRLLQGVDGWSLLLIRAHPAYGRTVVMLAEGCDSPTVRAVAGNAVRVLERPAPPPMDELRRHEVQPWHSVYLETYRLSAPQQRQLQDELAGQEVLVCWYRNDDPATNTYTQEIRRLAWFRSLPPRAGAWSRSATHPLAVLGTLLLESCPDNVRHFESARSRADARPAPPLPRQPAAGSSAPNRHQQAAQAAACRRLAERIEHLRESAARAQGDRGVHVALQRMEQRHAADCGG